KVSRGLDGLGDDPVDVRTVGQVAQHNPGTATQRLDLGGDLGGELGVAAVHDDVGAGFGERAGEGPAEATGGSGDEGGAVGEGELVDDAHASAPSVGVNSVRVMVASARSRVEWTRAALGPSTSSAHRTASSCVR